MRGWGSGGGLRPGGGVAPGTWGTGSVNGRPQGLYIFVEAARPPTPSIMVRDVAGEKPQNHERLLRLQDELRSLIAQADYLRAQIDVVNATIQDLAAGLEVLDYLKKYGEGRVVLVPIGAGNFIKAKVEKVDTVIMGVGGRLSVEASVDDARKMMEERIRLLEQLRLDLLRKLEEVNRKINEILPEVERLAREEQAQQQ